MIVVTYSFPGGSGVLYPAPAARLDGETDLAFAQRIAARDLPEGATDVQFVDALTLPAVPPPTKAERIQDRLNSDPEFAALAKSMANAQGKTLAQLRDELAAELP